MGYQLSKALPEALDSDITGFQRAVALEVADDATRKSFVDLEDLVRWIGAKDTAVIRNALKRLAAAGLTSWTAPSSDDEVHSSPPSGEAMPGCSSLEDCVVP